MKLPMNALSDRAEPGPEFKSRVARLLGASPNSFTRVLGGYTPAARWIVRTDARSYFVKAATTPLTAEFLRREMRIYAAVTATFVPELVAAEDDARQPVLVLEDLSGHEWPPPWTAASVDAMLQIIHEMHATRASIEPYVDIHGSHSPGWSEIARDPQPFLGLGLASSSWLEHALPHLMAGESRCLTEGHALTHMDLRSDNMCVRGGRAMLIDWNLACLSNPKLDLGFWLPSLEYEGGPAPETLLPDAPEVAAFVSGFFACRAGLADIPDAPRVRLVQRQQLQTAMPWAIRALDLPPMTG
jgi:thiamine kinase-like enzyme